MPLHEGSGIPEPPEKIHWNRVSTLTEGVKVFIGGKIEAQNNRYSFVSSKEEPLMVIFYNCPDSELTSAIIRAARNRNEYWNSFSSFSLVIGALSLIYIAAYFLNRPAYRITVISALVAVFLPIFPIIPPGLLFTVLYRRMTWQARNLRANADLASIGIYPVTSARRYAIRAYTLEAAAWFILLSGIFINVVFIFLIFRLLGTV